MKSTGYKSKDSIQLHSLKAFIILIAILKKRKKSIFPI